MATRQTFDISFYCRKSKCDKNGLAPIELSIIINSERCYLSLQRKERPEEFQTAIASKKTNPIKTFCENQRRLVDDYVEQMAFANVPLTASNLKECLKKGYVTQFYSLGDLWRDILDNQLQKVSVGDIHDLTYNKYILAKSAFYKSNNFTDTTPANDVDLQSINKFQLFLREQGMQQPTIYNYHSRVKAAFTLAFNRGKIKSSPYAAFKMNKGEKKDIVWLTEQELRILSTKDLRSDRLSKVRDAFLFQCYSGLSFSDMSLLKKEDYKFDKRFNQIYVEKCRVKTNEKFTSIILKEGKAILEKYDYQIPCLSNQKYNSYLKEIQALCRIEKVLHSHLGRTTYICYLYNKGVSIDVIKTLVGHSSAKTTLKYYAEMDKNTLMEAIQKMEGEPVIQLSKHNPNVDSANDTINEFFKETIYKAGCAAPSNADLILLEDNVINHLLSLKQKSPDAYRTLFAKCVATTLSRESFYKKQIATCKQIGDSTELKSLSTLRKSAVRLQKTLKGLDARLYTTIAK